KMRYEVLSQFKNIVAPFDGIIVQRSVDLGSLISAGSNGTPQQLFIIASTDIIRIFVEVPQAYFESITEGVEGKVTIREFPNREFSAKVKRYAKALDPVTRTLLTELHIDNKNGELLAGIYADVTFTIPPQFPVFVIPTQAVIIRQGPPEVAVLDKDDIVHLKTVRIGQDLGKTFTIEEGITANDRIVTNPSEKIKEGTKVKIAPTL
ncbi:MAG TPA: efflux RND transporter periplasmic adaptor subunit, partial [Chlamydiales bacterium]|nr:efflux RND transporter periplasmic adaptor subunit [Chlamydiales bacterium]